MLFSRIERSIILYVSIILLEIAFFKSCFVNDHDLWLLSIYIKFDFIFCISYIIRNAFDVIFEIEIEGFLHDRSPYSGDSFSSR